MAAHQNVNSTGTRALREAIAKSRLTTEQLVAKLGCTRKSLSNWRNGHRPSDYMGRLNEVLTVDLWPFYTEQSQHPVQETRHATEESAERLSVGRVTIDWVVIALERFGPSQIRCTYDRSPAPLPPDLEELHTAFVEDWQRRESEGEANLPFNSLGYKLKEFSAGYREIVDGEEVPTLRLRFGPTDYFTQIVTDLNLGNPIRQRYARAVPLTHRPVAEFASILGVNLSLVTSDGYLIVAERHPHVFVGPGKLHTSVGEGLQRPVDAGPNGAPDPFRAACRGALEELGIDIPPQELEFGAFGVQPDQCQYSLFGAHRLQETRDEILNLRSFGVPKDKWETSRLLFVPFNPTAIAAFALEHFSRWSPIGLAAAILSLWQMGHSLGEIHRAFA